MDDIDPLRFIFAFIFVLGLIGVLAIVLKRYGQAWQSGKASADTVSRLEILEVRYIDPKRKLVLVRRDRAEHLLLLAEGRELVIESISNSE